MNKLYIYEYLLYIKLIFRKYGVDLDNLFYKNIIEYLYVKYTIKTEPTYFYYNLFHYHDNQITTIDFIKHFNITNTFENLLYKYMKINKDDVVNIYYISYGDINKTFIINIYFTENPNSIFTKNIKIIYDIPIIYINKLLNLKSFVEFNDYIYNDENNNIVYFIDYILLPNIVKYIYYKLFKIIFGKINFIQ